MTTKPTATKALLSTIEQIDFEADIDTATKAAFRELDPETAAA